MASRSPVSRSHHVNPIASWRAHVRLSVRRHARVSGELEVDHTGYPVIEGIRTKESSSAAEEAVLAAVTKSALTATRKSTKYAKADFAAGFGTDVSFQTVDSAGVTTELGAIGMQHTGDGGSTADIVFKTWNGADTTGYTGDYDGDYNRLTIHANGGIAAPTSAPPRSPRPAAL